MRNTSMKNRSLFLFGAAGLSFMMLTAGPAARGGMASSPDEIIAYMGETRIVPAHGLQRVAVGNPSIADLANVNKDGLTVVPKTPGATTLTMWDSLGEQTYNVKIYVENTNELKRRIDNLLQKLSFSEISTQASDEEDRVFLIGRVKTSQERERIKDALGDLSKKVLDLLEVSEEQGVIGIDVQLLELDQDASDTLGFTWPGSISLTEVGSPAIQPAGAKWQYLWKVLNGRRSAFSLQLDALLQEGKARILSRPRLSCQSGKEAKLFVGGEVPTLTTNVVSGTTSAGATTIEYKEFGITLKIKPIITDNDRIKLVVNVEVSDIGQSLILGPVNAPTALAFPLSKRNASTELYLDNGQTLSIGGLIKQKTEEDLRKFPWLSDIPVLGAFFSKRIRLAGGGAGSRGNTELYITITPTIVTTDRKSEAAKDAAVRSQGVAQPAPAETAAGIKAADPAAAYTLLVHDRIMGNLSYPPSAAQAGFQGTVKLQVRLSYVGRLLDVKVKQPSGYGVLDDEAVRTVKKISSYPPFPPSIQGQDLWIDIPVEFKIQ